MALYQNGILISGANKLPQMTYAEWQALPVSERPSEWICTDRSYSDLPASDVTYDNTDSGLSADNIQDAIDEVAQSGGSGGHVIQNASGTAVAQEPTMQFSDAHVSDDSENDKTIIENIKSVASADYSSETEDGLYLIPDGDGSVIEPASEEYVEVTGNGTKTYSQVLADLLDLLDSSKLTTSSVLRLIYTNGTFEDLQFEYKGISAVRFYNTYTNASDTLTGTSISLGATCYYNSTSGSKSSTVCPNGEKIRIYYGNDKAVVDLQTTANRCLMSDGTTTVEQALTTNIISETETVAPIVGQSVYKDFTMPNDGKKYACTVTVALGTSKSAKAEMWASGTALLSSIAAAFINVSDMPIDCAQTMTLFANGNGGNLRVYIWTRSTDCDTYTIKLNAVSI